MKMDVYMRFSREGSKGLEANVREELSKINSKDEFYYLLAELIEDGQGIYKRKGTEDIRIITDVSDEKKAELFRVIQNRGVEFLQELNFYHKTLYLVDNVSSKLIAPYEFQIEALDDLIGMEDLKSYMRQLQAYEKINRIREQKGLPSQSLNLHMVFEGNPGTGKTEAAKRVAKILKDFGLLSKGHVVQTNRSRLVAEHIGGTAKRVREAVEEALGGVLFIDEAYSLTSESERDFGKEAVATLVELMETYRGQFVVIAAGYPREMDQFLESNPGLKSRMKVINFRDYDPSQLRSILMGMFRRKKYFVDEDGLICLSQKINDMYSNRRNNFGNAREMRNLFEQVCLAQSERLAGKTDVTEDDLREILWEDCFACF